MQGPNPLNQEVARSRVGDGLRRAELSRAVRVAEAARRSKGQTRNPWAVMASAFRRDREPASTPVTRREGVPARRKPAVA